MAPDHQRLLFKRYNDLTMMPDEPIVDSGADRESAAALALNTFIENQSCVLLLGPLFGLDSTGQKIHEVLKAELRRKIGGLNLDDEFDNLYISRTTPDLGNAYLSTTMANFYRNTSRNNVYDSIMGLRFRAILSFTADSYLVQADPGKHFDSSYFSFKPKEDNQDQDPAFGLNKPISYNLFGSIGDFNSLVTDYDTLYDFLIGLLKADQELPLRLKDILSNATAFVFLGFDLSRWYVPLIVRKLSKFILKDSRHKQGVNAFATLDDTPTALTQSVFDSLNKFPFTFIPFKKMSSHDLINFLTALPANNNGNPAIQPAQSSLTPNERAFFELWKEKIKTVSRVNPDEGLDELFDDYDALNYTGQFSDALAVQRRTYRDLSLSKYATRILNEEYVVGFENVLAALQEIIKQVLKS